MTQRLDYQDPEFTVAFRNLINCKREVQADVSEAVATILSDVKSRGDVAVCESTAKFDRFNLTPESIAFKNHEIAGETAGASSSSTQ